VTFLREKPFKKWANHAYCIQAEIGNNLSLNLQTPTLCINGSMVSVYFSFFGFDFSLSYSYRTDHAGLLLHISLPFAFFHFNIYNTNHWDHEEGRWKTKVDYDKELVKWKKKQRAKK
jgi:hypothetical protein